MDIDEQGVLFAVITDFGVTQVVKQNALLVKAFRVSNTAGISPCYGAPELLGQNLVAMRIPSIAQAADTFSFAVILAEIVTRTAPWNFSKSLNDVVQAVVIGERAYPRPLYFGAQDYHRDVASLVERCWAQAPRARPEMHAVYADLVEVLEKITGRK